MRITQTIQAASALIAGLYVTFAQAHDAKAGMVALLIISIGWFAAAILSLAQRRFVIFNIFIGAGAVAMAWLSQTLDANSSTDFAWGLLESWALFGALAEVVFGLVAKRAKQVARDHWISAGLAALLFIALLAVTDAGDSVSRVGFFGAYAILLAAHLGIAAASPKA